MEIKKRRLTKKQKQLVADNAGLIWVAMKRISCDLHLYEEALSAANFALCHCAMYYKPSKGTKFSHYAIPIMRMMIRQCLKEQTESLVPVDPAQDVNFPMRFEEMGEAEAAMIAEVNCALDSLTDWQRNATALRWGIDDGVEKKNREVAEILGLTYRQVDSAICNARQKLKPALQHLTKDLVKFGHENAKM